MTIPGGGVHRRNRKKLGRGQNAAARFVSPTLINSGPSVTLIFSAPVVITGPIPLTVQTLTATSQTTENPTTATIVFNGDTSARSYSLPNAPRNISSTTGGQIVGITGKFGGSIVIPADNIAIADGAGGFIGGRGTILNDGSVALATNTFTIDPAGNVAAASFAGDGSSLTGLNYSQLSGTPPNIFDQSLNTTDSPSFSGLYLIGGEINLKGYNLRLADLNTHAGGVLNLEAGTLDFGDGFQWKYNYTTGLIENPVNPPIFANLILQGGDIQAQINDLYSAVTTIQAQLAAGATGTSTPGTGTTTATNGIVTALT